MTQAVSLGFQFLATDGFLLPHNVRSALISQTKAKRSHDYYQQAAWVGFCQEVEGLMNLN